MHCPRGCLYHSLEGPDVVSCSTIVSGSTIDANGYIGSASSISTEHKSSRGYSPCGHSYMAFLNADPNRRPSSIPKTPFWEGFHAQALKDVSISDLHHSAMFITTGMESSAHGLTEFLCVYK